MFKTALILKFTISFCAVVIEVVHKFGGVPIVVVSPAFTMQEFE